MKKITSAILLLVLMLSLVFAGCNKQNDNNTSSKQQEQLVKVGFSQAGTQSTWQIAQNTSIKNAISINNGYSLVFADANLSQKKQIESIRNFIKQKVDYIVFSPVTVSNWDTVLKEAKNAKIPVIIVGDKIDSSEELYTAWVGVDYENQGKLAANWLVNYLKDKNKSAKKINLVTIAAKKDSQAQTGRSKGFEAIANEYKEYWKNLKTTYADSNQAKAEKAMQSFIKDYKDIDVVIAQSDEMAIGAVKAIKKAGKTCGIDGDIIIISYEATFAGLSGIRDKSINVDVESNPLHGPKIKEIINNLSKGNKVEKFNYAQDKVFTYDSYNPEKDTRAY